MGNRTYLFYETHCNFEANNCIPITWLALFEPQEFLVEELTEDEGEIARYKTSQLKALKRLDQFINQLHTNRTVWKYFRPLEILKDELSLYPRKTAVILDLTQFWAINESYQDKTRFAVDFIKDIIIRFTQNKDDDLLLLNNLVNQFNLGNIASLSNLNGEDLMHILIGMYIGEPEKEKKYSLEYFNTSYWAD